MFFGVFSKGQLIETEQKSVQNGALWCPACYGAQGMVIK